MGWQPTLKGWGRCIPSQRAPPEVRQAMHCHFARRPKWEGVAWATRCHKVRRTLWQCDATKCAARSGDAWPGPAPTATCAPMRCDATHFAPHSAPPEVAGAARVRNAWGWKIDVFSASRRALGANPLAMHCLAKGAARSRADPPSSLRRVQKNVAEIELRRPGGPPLAMHCHIVPRAKWQRVANTL